MNVKGQNCMSHYPPEACSTYLRSGWSVVRSVLLAKGSTSKNKLSLHLHKVLTCSNKLSPHMLYIKCNGCPIDLNIII